MYIYTLVVLYIQVQCAMYIDYFHYYMFSEQKLSNCDVVRDTPTRKHANPFRY